VRTASRDIKKYLRVIDANLNRSAEGLRVCEDMARFALGDGTLQRSLKRMRHEVMGIGRKAAARHGLLLYRDSGRDVGKRTGRSDRKRNNEKDIFFANSQRVKESLRVLEEVAKCIDPRWSDAFKKVRFRLYTAEKRAFKKFIVYYGERQ